MNNMKLMLSVVAISIVVASGCNQGSPESDFAILAEDLPDAKQAARTAGISLVPKALQKSSYVAPDDNAWPIMRDAVLRLYSEYRTGKDRFSQLQKLSNTDSASAKREAQLQFDRIQKDLDKVAVAAKKSTLAFERNMSSSNPFSNIETEYAPIKTSVRLLLWRAHLRIRSDDVSGGIADLRTAYQVCRLLSGDQTFVGNQVCLAIRNLIREQVVKIVSEFPNQRVVISQLLGVVTQLESPPDWFATFLEQAAEAYQNLNGNDGLSMKNLEILLRVNAGEGITYQDVVPRGFPERELVAAYSANLLRGLVRLKERIKVEADPFVRIAIAKQEVNSWMNPKVAVNNWNRLVFSYFDDYADTIIRSIVRFRCTKAGLAVVEFRATRGAWPATLEQAGFSELDPFSSKPLRFVRQENKFEIYSVWKDLEDNGGQNRLDPTDTENEMRDCGVTFAIRG